MTREASSPNRYACGATAPTVELHLRADGVCVRHAALGERHREPALAAVVRRGQQPAPHAAARTVACSAFSRRRVERAAAGRRSCRGSTCSHSLPPSSPRVSPSTAMTSPGFAEAMPHGLRSRRAAAPPRRPSAWGGWPCRRSRCRGYTLPLTTGTSSARHASAMPRVASANCHMISGRSGLPKFRQSVRPSGSPPTQETLRAHSATASRAPSYGSR